MTTLNSKITGFGVRIRPPTPLPEYLEGDKLDPRTPQVFEEVQKWTGINLNWGDVKGVCQILKSYGFLRMKFYEGLDEPGAEHWFEARNVNYPQMALTATGQTEFEAALWALHFYLVPLMLENDGGTPINP